MQRIAEHLEHGDSRAAIVVSTDPELLIAAYTDESACIQILITARESLAYSQYSTVSNCSGGMLVYFWKKCRPTQSNLILHDY